MSDNVALAYSEAGAGTPLVLLHGFPLSGAIWREQQQQLSDHYRVIVPDLRGHGRSPTTHGVYEMDALARDVLALLDSLHIKQAVIMGHSMGGYVTLAAARIAPERFLALGLIASQAGADTEEGRQARYRTAEKVAAGGSQVIAEMMLPKLFAANLPAKTPIIEKTRQLMLTTDLAGIIGSLQGMAARPDSGALLPHIGMSALILAGEQDQIIPLEKARAMAASMKSATLTIVPDAGHMPMLEQPEATTAAIRGFLKRLGM